jgi:hypothetical protein
MAVRNGNRVEVGASRLMEQRQTGAAFAFRMHPGIEQDAVLIQFHQPTARADVLVRIQVCDIHAAGKQNSLGAKPQ